MKIYRVGGSVRDTLLGLPVQDVDYVVVGASPEKMIAAGFIPVGKDFPVFIHPQTHAEYALARTERKSAPGYHGFVFHCAPDVTLEQDLQRRDLTINAMAIAEEADSGEPANIIDPFGGQRDLAAKVFRHVSDAFSEDPVRILRVARFAARLNEFALAPETLQLMRAMVQSGEVNALTPERVWQEIARALMEPQPSRMIEVLRETGALQHVMPEVETILRQYNDAEIRMKQIADHAAQSGFSLAVRWAAMLSACIDNSTENINLHSTLAAQLCARLKTPSEVSDITQLVLREHSFIEPVLMLAPEDLVHLLERCDAFRRPARFTQIIQAVFCAMPANSAPQQTYLEKMLEAARAIPGGAIAESIRLRFPNQPQQIAAAIFTARVEAIKALVTQSNPHQTDGK